VSIPGAWEQKELATRLVGDAGSSVTLSFEKTNKGARYDVAITREPVSAKVAKMPLPQASAEKKETAL
jgi:C-terminal processing protease CtpA/Prc